MAEKPQRTFMGTMRKIFSKTDIPPKVTTAPGHTVRTKNVVYMSGPSTWKNRVKAGTGSASNSVLAVSPPPPPAPPSSSLLNGNGHSHLENGSTLIVANGTMQIHGNGNASSDFGGSMVSANSGVRSKAAGNVRVAGTQSTVQFSTLPPVIRAQQQQQYMGNGGAQTVQQGGNNYVPQTLPKPANKQTDSKADKKKNRETFRNYVYINEYDDADNNNSPVSPSHSSGVSSSNTPTSPTMQLHFTSPYNLGAPQQQQRSPFAFAVTDATNVTASGDGLGLVPCGKPTSFTVLAPGGRMQDIKVKILGPDGREVYPRLHDNGSGNFLVDWTPRIPGDHKVDVRYRDQPIPGSVFTAKAWDATAVIVSNIRPGRMGKPNYFNVDASRAGAGNLELIVSVSGDNVPNFVKAEGNARFEVSFTPHTADTHMISVKFNGEIVPGSPFPVEMDNSGRVFAMDSGMIRVPVGRTATISIDPRKGADLAEQAVVEVISPSDKIKRARVEPISKRCLKAKFVPDEIGPHCIQAMIGDFEIPGSPFGCEVYDITQVKLSKMPLGLVGKPYAFEIDASRAGAGDVEVKAKCDNKSLPTKVMPKEGGIYKGYFMPKDPRRHIVFVTFGGESVPGSPYVVNVEDGTLVVASGRCLEATPIHEAATFTIDPTRAPFKSDAKVTMTGPPPMRRPIRFKSRGDYVSGWTVDWTPKDLGVHTIDVKYGGSHVQGSPFRCKVFDLSKVKLIRDESLQGVDLDGIPGEDVVFFVDASEAGAGNLEIIVRCASTGQRLPNFLEAEDRSGKFRIFFTPKENCFRYRVDVTFNEQQVQGSPFYASVVDGSKATASGDGLKNALVGRPAPIVVVTQHVGGEGVERANCVITVTGPSGRQVPVRVTGSPHAGFDAEYTPVEVGRHTVKILYADVDVQGSPFTVNVHDSGNVRVGNIPDGVLNKPVIFEVDASSAGDGTLSVDVQAATSKPYPEVMPLGGGKYQVSFVPHEASPHAISVLFAGAPVTGSPFTCMVYDAASALQVQWGDDGGSGSLVPVRRPVYVTINPKRLPQQPITAQVQDPFNRSMHARVERLPDGIQRIEFTPTEVGGHVVSILYGGQPVPGSPHTTTAYDASRLRIVDVTQDGAVGQDHGFTVDTTDAGPGEISVEVTNSLGQSVPTTRRQLDTFHQRHTFLPTQHGEHNVHVLFNGDTVPGSPLAMEVANPLRSLSVNGSSHLGIVDQLSHMTISTRGSSSQIDPKLLAVTVSGY